MSEKNIRKVLTGLLVVSIFLFFTSCKTKTITEYVPIEVEKKVTETIRDTTIIYIPQKDEKQNIAKAKDTSRIENKYAISWAFWDGYFLYHNLKTKQDSIPINIQYKERFTTISTPVIYPVKGDIVTVYKMKWYEKILFYVGLLSILIISIYSIVNLIKRKMK